MSWPGAGGRSTRLSLHGPSPSHEPGAHYLDHLLDGKAVGDHQPCSERADWRAIQAGHLPLRRQ